MTGDCTEIAFEELETFFKKGCSPAEAVDYLAVERYGKSQSGWGRIRGRSQPTISENIEKATRRIEEQPRPCTKCGETRPDSELSPIRSGNSKTDYRWEDYCHDCISDMS